MPTAYTRGRHWTDTVDPTTSTTVYSGVRISEGDTWWNSTSSTLFVCTSASAGTWSSISGGGGGGGGGTTWLNGSGAPSAGTGSNGDYYMDTDNGDVYYKAAGSWTRHNYGTPGMIPLASASGSSVANVDISLTGTYDAYAIRGRWLPATNGVNLEGLVTTDSFSTVKTGASDYSWADPRGGISALGTGGSKVDAMMQLATNCGNRSADDEHASGWIWVHDPHHASKFTKLVVHLLRGRLFSADSEVASHFGGAEYNASTAVNGIRMSFSSGNIADYAYTLYGLSS